MEGCGPPAVVNRQLIFKNLLESLLRAAKELKRILRDYIMI